MGRVKVRRTAFIVWPLVALLFTALSGLATASAATATTSDTAAGLAVAFVAAFLAIRCLLLGLDVGPDEVVVRSFVWSRRLPAQEVAGLAIEPVMRRRWARLVVITHAGEAVPVSLAAWGLRSADLTKAVYDVVPRMPAPSVDCTPPAELLERRGQLEHPSAFTVARRDGTLVAVPARRPGRGLTSQTVTAVTETSARRLLGPETVTMAVAFVLPAAVSAVVILARHVARVSNLDEFALPLPGHLTASLLLMLALYMSTAVLVPLALVLLARTGSPPGALGLSRSALRRDAFPGIGLLLVSWLTSVLVLIPFSPLLNNHSVSNAAHNTHVPAYFVVYAVVASAVTAVNEEVIVNGYLLTRLAQLGWRPWPSLWVSLALRTSYHAYYGLALLATVPFGYWATRSFQKHGRLGRPIVAHFVNDAVLLTAAVLTS